MKQKICSNYWHGGDVKEWRFYATVSWSFYAKKLFFGLLLAAIFCKPCKNLNKVKNNLTNIHSTWTMWTNVLFITYWRFRRGFSFRLVNLFTYLLLLLLNPLVNLSSQTINHKVFGLVRRKILLHQTGKNLAPRPFNAWKYTKINALLSHKQTIKLRTRNKA